MRIFLEWYNSIPDNIKKDTTKNYDKIYEINKILKKLEESDEMKNQKPSIEELKNWIETKQI